ncbi:hypothetical protein TcasGA2_TC016113 [Tribolium castaneum]|uniref:Uncharacterized protein n=1 Tax=Tribolium castaneum TaxID=7070 RepID=D7EIR7_TRICA|nr:hypothetical protein TcasGA2_TC016113 [Tribolium castaneum]
MDRLFEEDPTHGLNNYFKMVKIAQAKEAAVMECSDISKSREADENVYYQYYHRNSEHTSKVTRKIWSGKFKQAGAYSSVAPPPTSVASSLGRGKFVQQ